MKTANIFLVISITFSFLMSPSPLKAQKILINDSQRRLMEVDIDGCNERYIATIGNFTDIAAHPDGNLYAINSSGELYKVDFTNIGVFQVAKFEGTTFYGLTSDAEGNLYAASHSGDLGSFNPLTEELIAYPNMGYGASGDLTFYKGQLYMATSANTLVSIFPNQPENNELIIDFSDQNVEIFGIVSTLVGCEIKTFAISGNQRSRIYEIDFENRTFTFICTANIRIYGGSSDYEFKGSESLLVLDEMKRTNTDCSSEGFSIEFKASGVEDRQILYSLDNVNYQTDPVFENIDTGNYYVYLLDDFGCEGIDSFVVKPPGLGVSEISKIPARCGDDNGAIQLGVSSEADEVFLLMDGILPLEGSFLTELPPGAYAIDATDTDGCEAGFEFQISAIPGIKISGLAMEDATCGDNNGTIAMNFDKEIKSVRINEERYFDFPITNKAPGNYHVFIEDVDGCLIDTTVTITQLSDCKIFIPNIFSPDDNGVNDMLTIYSDIPRSVKYFTIFDRWGNKVYESRNTMTGGTEGWDGTYNGRPVNAGNYSYSLILGGEREDILLKGSVTIIN